MHRAVLALVLAYTASASPLRRRDDLLSCLSASNVPFLVASSQAWSSAISPFNQRLAGQYIPAAVAQPANTGDVVNAVKCAAEYNVATVGKSGGHSYTADSMGGQNGSLVIDVGKLNSVSLNGEIATIGAGNRLGDVALALYEQGQRALPHGTCPEVGVGGHVLAGGFGMDSRAWGLSLDRVVAHDIVLSNGTLLTVDNQTAPDLFWALRGAGWSMGIVTSFHFATLPAPPQNVNFSYSYNLDTTGSNSEAAQFMSKFQDWCSTSAPADLGIELDIGRSSSGRISVSIAGAFLGNQSDFDAFMQPFLSTLPARSGPDNVQQHGWIDSLEGLGGVHTLNTSGVTDNADNFYASSLMVPESRPLNASAWQAFVSYLGNEGSTSDTDWFVQVELYGGKNSAITSVASNATAFANRDALFTMQLYASSHGSMPPYPSDGISFVQGMRNAVLNNVPTDFPRQSYRNYQDDQLASSGTDSWQTNYFNANYDRLREIKRVYDPINLFRQPQSIEL